MLLAHDHALQSSHVTLFGSDFKVAVYDATICQWASSTVERSHLRDSKQNTGAGT